MPQNKQKHVVTSIKPCSRKKSLDRRFTNKQKINTHKGRPPHMIADTRIQNTETGACTRKSSWKGIPFRFTSHHALSGTRNPSSILKSLSHQPWWSLWIHVSFS